VEIHTADDSGVLVVSVSGRLDSTTSPALDAEVRRQLAAQVTRIVFDLTGVDYISSAGLRVFMTAARDLRGRGRVALAGSRSNVRQILDIAGAASFATISATRTEAVLALKG